MLNYDNSHTEKTQCIFIVYSGSVCVSEVHPVGSQKTVQ